MVNSENNSKAQSEFLKIQNRINKRFHYEPLFIRQHRIFMEITYLLNETKCKVHRFWCSVMDIHNKQVRLESKKKKPTQ